MIDPRELQEWRKRRDRYKARAKRESNALESLTRRLQKSRESLSIADDWTAEQKAMFEQGVNQYRGQAREQYCEATGLTSQFVETSSMRMLLRAAVNIGLVSELYSQYLVDVNPPAIPDDVKDSNTRKRLHMFIWYG